MLRLLRMMILGVLVMAGLIGVSMAYGRTLESPRLLRLVDTLACYLHDCPDIDTVQAALSPDERADVRALFEQMSSKGGKIRYDDFDVHYYHGINSTHPDGALVVYFEDTSGRGLVTLGDMLAYHGQPCVLIFTDDTTYIQYATFYAGIDVVYRPNAAESINTVLSPFTPVESLFIYEKPVPCETPLTFAANFNIFADWQGFRTVGFYIVNRNRGV